GGDAEVQEADVRESQRQAAARDPRSIRSEIETPRRSSSWLAGGRARDQIQMVVPARDCFPRRPRSRTAAWRRAGICRSAGDIRLDGVRAELCELSSAGSGGRPGCTSAGRPGIYGLVAEPHDAGSADVRAERDAADDTRGARL